MELTPGRKFLRLRRLFCQMGKAQVDGHLAATLFFQPIRVDPGQRMYQRRFAMIDVP